MRVSGKLCGFVGLVGVLLALSGSAQAQRTGAQVLGLETLRSGISVAGLFGAGFDIEDDYPGDPNPYGVGLGFRAGYTLPDVPFYFGGTFIGHFGDTVGTVSFAGFNAELSVNYLMVGGEAGYDVIFDEVTLRPYMGLGVAILNADCDPDTDFCPESQNELYFSIGGELLFYLQENFFLGGDMRFSFVTDTPDGIQLFFTGGVNF